MSISGRLDSLKRKHDELEEQIDGLQACPSTTNDELQPLKRRKLRIKDEMTRIETSGAT